MQWTTGDASGGSGGFGGAPATVGYNAGNAFNYEQVGRFDHEGVDYDGPFDANDGVSWLDGSCHIFNSAADSDGDGVDDCFDCDDADPDIYPGAEEVCDGADNDCDGEIDEGFDVDGDDYTSCGGDCNDGDASINPDAEEVCDGVDNNCDGNVDEGFTNTDGDDQADCVDPDDDNDGCLDAVDANPLESSGDTDCDGIHDDCDVCPSGDDTVDNNADGIPDCSQLLDYEEYSAEWYCAENKIAICHNGHTVCVSKNALQAHFDHGDNIGPCPSCDDNGEGMNIAGDHFDVSALVTQLEVFPNPAIDHIIIRFAELQSNGILTIVDQLNRVIWKEKVVPGQRFVDLHLTHEQFTNGMFIAMIEGDEQLMLKRFVINR